LKNPVEKAMSGSRPKSRDQRRGPQGAFRDQAVHHVLVDLVGMIAWHRSSFKDEGGRMRDEKILRRFHPSSLLLHPSRPFKHPATEILLDGGGNETYR
jgi:hypothetical protein